MGIYHHNARGLRGGSRNYDRAVITTANSHKKIDKDSKETQWNAILVVLLFAGRSDDNNGRKGSLQSNKEKRKSVYAKIAFLLHPATYRKGMIIDPPPCVVAKVRTVYPDLKYSSFNSYSRHMNR